MSGPALDRPGADVWAREGLRQIPLLLTLLDRNPHSPSYGCFDRNFWHYKIIDFPSGMAQEFVWPLALATVTQLPDNPYVDDAAVREWVSAGIRYAARSAHADGACDDYFPYERAGGAAAFSLLACLESYRLLGLDDADMRAFFALRADWLAGHRESGRLANHQALIALCLLRAGEVLGETRWARALEERLELVLGWQHDEGWFDEYGGFDPGYHSLTIGCLASLLDARPADERLREALVRAVRLAAQFVHPDGTYGGEYGSRNTLSFFPHGFERVGRWLPESLAINDRVVAALDAGLSPCYADDHTAGHHAWSYLLAARDAVRERPVPPVRAIDPRTHLPGAGMVIERRGATELYLALNKGGTFKLFRDGALVASDTQLSVRLREGRRRRNAVAHLLEDCPHELGANGLRVSGRLGWAKQKQMSPANLLILRGISLTIGRVAPNLVRKLLQRLLITGKTVAPFEFERETSWEEGATLVVRDTLRAPSWRGVESVLIGVDQTSIYVVMSRTFQRAQLCLPHDLSERVAALPDGEPLTVTRRL